MLSPGVPWPAALCWAAVLSTSSAPLGCPHPIRYLPSAWSQEAQEQVGKDIPGFPTWAQGPGASNPAEELVGGTEQSLGGHAPTLDLHSISKMSFPHTLVRHPQT